MAQISFDYSYEPVPQTTGKDDSGWSAVADDGSCRITWSTSLREAKVFAYIDKDKRVEFFVDFNGAFDMTPRPWTLLGASSATDTNGFSIGISDGDYYAIRDKLITALSHWPASLSGTVTRDIQIDSASEAQGRRRLLGVRPRSV
jgi:hypothetical protein